MRITDTSDLWWKTAVVYCLDVQTFMDWNDDGMGDFAGLAERLDYLAELGVTCLWLMPFYPTTDRDDGYDITDYYGVDPRLGHARRLRRGAPHRPRPRHAGDHRPGRQPHLRPAPVVPVRRESSRTSPYRDFYVWRADEPPDTPRRWCSPTRRTASGSTTRRPASGTCTASTGTSPTSTSPTRGSATRSSRRWASGWSWASPASGWTRCRSCSRRRRRQASWTASRTRTSTCATCGRSSAGARGDGILLGEVNLPHKDQQTFFGGTDGDELTMQFDFIGMQNLYLVPGPAGRPARWRKALRARPAIPADSQWATFVRNHDELTLDKLTDARARRRSSPPSGPTPRCSSTAAACGAGCRPCSTATRAGSGWSTACCSPCPAPRCSSTARRSAWARTSTSTAGWPCAPRCSGRRPQRRLLDRRTVRLRLGRSWTGASGPSTSTSPRPDARPGFAVDFMATLIKRYRECPELGWGDFEILKQPRSPCWPTAAPGRSQLVLLHNLSPEPVTVELGPGHG